MKKEKFCLILIFILIVILTGSESIVYSAVNKEFTEHLQLNVEGKIYRLGLMQTGALRGEAAIDRDEKIVTDKKILRKIFHAGRVCGFFPETEKENRFHNLIGRVQYFQSIFQEGLNIIPVMEFLGFYAFNLGPRAVVEALEIALTGGGSLLAKGGKAVKVIGKKVVKEVAKSTAKQTLKDLVKNPRTYILSTVYSLLKGSISQFEWIKRKAGELKQRRTIRYDELVQLEEIFWKARAEGWIALKIYEKIKGDLISNLLDALKNSVEQLLSDVEYSEKIVTTVFLANQFKKVLDTTQVMRTAAEEMGKINREREEMERISRQYREKDIELSIKIANEMKRIPDISLCLKKIIGGYIEQIEISGENFWIVANSVNLGILDTRTLELKNLTKIINDQLRKKLEIHFIFLEGQDCWIRPKGVGNITVYRVSSSGILNKVMGDSDFMWSKVMSSRRSTISNLCSRASLEDYVEDENNIWLAYFKGGVYCYDKNSKRCKEIYFPGTYEWPTSLAIMKNYLFVGTRGKGLAVIDLSTNKVKESILSSLLKRTDFDFSVINVLESFDGFLWIGSADGLYRLDVDVIRKYLQ